MDRQYQTTEKKRHKKSESIIDLSAHDQTLKQQRQLNDRNHHIPINTNTECQKILFGKLDLKGRSNNLLFTGYPSH
jgi:hypothetical protein